MSFLLINRNAVYSDKNGIRCGIVGRIITQVTRPCCTHACCHFAAKSRRHRYFLLKVSAATPPTTSDASFATDNRFNSSINLRRSFVWLPRCNAASNHLLIPQSCKYHQTNDKHSSLFRIYVHDYAFG